MKLFVGLGNPGRKYAGNRHNVGFMAVDRIAQANGFSNWRKRFEGETADGMIDGEKVIILKPATYMNDSGRAVGAAVRFLKLDLADVFVFYDEIDLAAGKLKFKAGGGNAGHNGLRSISHLVGNAYQRVRIGVGHPGHKELVAGYVLHDFDRDEYEWLDPLLDAICSASARLASGDSARFLTDVTLKLDPPKQPKAGNSGKRGSKNGKTKGDGGEKSNTPDGKKDKAAEAQQELPAEKSLDSAPKDKKHRHATGERQSKRQSALAENLQNWLKGNNKK